ncbi:LLM class flavin-dependent oxidoreductase [Amycolatopsis pigmentata]|uniref:LLM class flavin-dependent oxidoreductase n=1 Tax=Amycolatopsis pigmentata TaxID=450801 RepID=A0ABW5G5C7_9PSEU
MSGAVSIMLPSLPARMSEVGGYAELVSTGRAERLWIGQSILLEPHQVMAYLAGRDVRIPVGTAVTLMPLRHPLEAALQARSLAALTGHSVVAGLGTGPSQFVAALRGKRYSSPLRAVREYASVMRALLSYDSTRFDGEYYSHEWPLPWIEHPRVYLGLGVLRRRMAVLAGEVADAVITWLAPLGHLAEVLRPAVVAGSTAAGRPVPRIVAAVGVALDGEGRDPLDLTLAAYAGHLTAPHYRAMFREAGLSVGPSQPAFGAGHLLAHEVVLTGDPARVADGIRRYWAAGVDEVVLHAGGVRTRYGDDQALADLNRVLDALAATDTATAAPLGQPGAGS